MEFKKTTVKEAKNNFTALLKEDRPVLITRHGRPAGVIHPIRDEDEFYEWQFKNDPKMIEKVSNAANDIQDGRLTPLRDLAVELGIELEEDEEEATSDLESSVKQSSPKLISDKPITGSSDDCLNREGFAHRIANTIKWAPEEESVVIGIFGSWGAGKTSVMAMVAAELESQKDLSVINFNPWRLGDEEQLTQSLFSEIGTILGDHGHDGKVTAQGKARKRAKLWEQYSRYLAIGKSVAQSLPLLLSSVLKNPDQTVLLSEPFSGAGSILTLLKTSLEQQESLSKIAKAEAESASRDMTLEEIRSDLRKACLEDASLPRIVVVIDDVDRLTNNEIRLVIKLMKANLDFPKITFVLLCDDTKVASALDAEVGEGMGQEYLTKIVQVGFHLPQPNQTDVETYFRKKLEELLYCFPNLTPTVWGKGQHKERFSSLQHDVLRECFSNLRNVNRYLNSVSLVISSFYHDETFDANLVDLMLLEAWKTFERDSFSSLCNIPPEFLLGERMIFEGQVEPVRQALESVIDAGKDKAIVRRMLHMAFPKTKAVLSGTKFDGAIEQSWTDQLRICSPENFNRYFELELRTNDLRESEFYCLISESDSSRIFASLNKLAEEEKLFNLISRLDQSETFKENLENPAPLLTQLWRIAPLLPSRNDFIASMNGYDQMRFLTNGVLSSKVQEKRAEILTKISNENGAAVACYIAAIYPPRENDEREELISVEQGCTLKRIALEKIAQARNDNILLNECQLWVGLLSWWHEQEPTEFTKEAERLLESKAGTEILLKLSSGVYSSDEHSRTYIDPESVEKYIGVERMKVALHNLGLGSIGDMGALFLETLEQQKRGEPITPRDSGFRPW